MNNQISPARKYDVENLPHKFCRRVFNQSSYFHNLFPAMYHKLRIAPMTQHPDTYIHVTWICQSSVITIAWPVLKDTDVAGSTCFVFGDDPVLGEGRNNDNHNVLNTAAKCELGIFAACPRTILDLSLSPALLVGERGLLISPFRCGPFKQI